MQIFTYESRFLQMCDKVHDFTKLSGQPVFFYCRNAHNEKKTYISYNTCYLSLDGS